MLDKLKSLLRRQKDTAGTDSVPQVPRTIAVTIGLDFGTSSTKCVVNVEGYRNGRHRYLAVTFPSAAYSNGTLCVPTSIGVSGKRFVFGEEAEKLPEDHVIRSLKMALPCMGTAWGDYEAPFATASRPGYFTMCGHSFSAADLATLYLANIIRQVKVQLKRYLPPDTHVQVYLNLAAPLDQLVRVPGGKVQDDTKVEPLLRDTLLSEHYDMLGQKCLRASTLLSDSLDLQDAAEIIQRLKDEPRLPFDKSPAYIVPETLAAIASYVNRPGTRSGRFMTLDVGAGSTDVSVFWLEKRSGTVKAWYYAAASLHTGMDAIDRSLRSITQRYSGASIRQRRERFQQRQGGLMACREPCHQVLAQIDRHRRQTFGRGYSKEPQRPIWGDVNRARVTLLLVGGGAQVDLIQEVAGQQLWENVIGGPTVEILGPDMEHVLLPDGKECPIDDLSDLAAQVHLLIIADGLAKRIVDIPPFDTCNEPATTPIPVKLDNRVFDHWW